MQESLLREQRALATLELEDNQDLVIEQGLSQALIGVRHTLKKLAAARAEGPVIAAIAPIATP